MKFIPLAEETGLIDPIGEWVVEEVARQAREWRAAGFAPQIAFNVSPYQLRRLDLAKMITDKIAAAGLDPSSFTVEITESAAMREPTRVEPILRDLHESGLKLAIDDFGAGYSSLGRLRAMNVDTLKIDRSFMCDVPQDREAAAIITGIIQLAEGLGVVTVAEGVETEDQRVYLREQGCDLAQGFGLCRPVPAEEITGLLARAAAAA
jgi:EAL domain-containing protein (putative c-di-GMP-specific phosphodiesterase class I)